LGAPRPSTGQRATPPAIEDSPGDNLFAPLSGESASRAFAPSTQTKLPDVRKVLREIPWMADYITDTWLAAVLRLDLNGAQDTPPSSLHRFRDKRPVSPAVVQLDAQVHTTLLRERAQGARPIAPAVVLRSEHDGAQDSPPTSLPVIRKKRPASPTVAPIDEQVHTTSLRATEQAARTTEEPPTTLPARTEPAAPVTPLAPWTSSKSSLSNAPNKTKSLSPQPRRSKRPGAGQN